MLNNTVCVSQEYNLAKPVRSVNGLGGRNTNIWIDVRYWRFVDKDLSREDIIEKYSRGGEECVLVVRNGACALVEKLFYLTLICTL